MKTTLKFLSIALLYITFLVITLPTQGQKKNTTLDTLCGGKWEMLTDYGDKNWVTETGNIFTKNKMIEYLLYARPEKYERSQDYYLSETPDTNFDQKKVGKIMNGKYLIVRYYNRINVFRIHKLTPTYLKLESIGGAIREFRRKEKESNQSSKK
ncbi:hypothetical protein [Butyricimonas sp.]|uniref:hypothetical protein n=1 Tax=Butyricimonas sp. TaxID=1969738 RepID=UPI0025C0D7BF|nr:hypothetical protein [Butyricimonas sp.]